MKLLQELFRANSYPRTFVGRRRKQPRKRNEEPIRPKSRRSIAYVKGLFKAVARSLAPLGKGLAHRPDSTICRQAMRLKDSIPKQEMSAIVYRLQFSCEMCNYVDETGQRLQTRMHEQKLDVRRLDPKLEVAIHATQMGHVFNFEAVGIVGRGDDHTARFKKTALLFESSRRSQGLAKWLLRRLKFLTVEADVMVSSSAQFPKKLKGVCFHPNEVMDQVIETIKLLPQRQYDETDNCLGHAQVLPLLMLCLKTFFKFDRTIYEQVNGT
nr:unnamed protein product [Spirometra erinaceieuropaei]